MMTLIDQLAGIQRIAESTPAKPVALTKTKPCKWKNGKAPLAIDMEKAQTIIDTMRGERMTQPEIVQRVTFSKSTVRIYIEAMEQLGLIRSCGKIGKSKLYRAENVSH